MDEKEKSKFRAINEAVCYWLGYQFKIGRERLIHEASLRYPIADTLTATGTEINKVSLEKGHPYFLDRVVDIFVFNKDIAEIKDGNFLDPIESMYELKIAKQETNTKYGIENQRIIDDILRLAYFNMASKKNSYFLICGRYMDFKNYFIGDAEKPKINKDNNVTIKEKNSNTAANDSEWKTKNSLYNDIFDFKITSPPEPKEYIFSKNIVLASDKGKKLKKKKFGLESFQERYKRKGNKVKFNDTIKIKTICIALTPFENITHRTHACGIWKIEAVK